MAHHATRPISNRLRVGARYADHVNNVPEAQTKYATQPSTADILTCKRYWGSEMRVRVLTLREPCVCYLVNDCIAHRNESSYYKLASLGQHKYLSRFDGCASAPLNFQLLQIREREPAEPSPLPRIR
jgi:hypothetical protein